MAPVPAPATQSQNDPPAEPSGAMREVRRRLAELDDLSRIGGLLGWDQQTKMPPAAAENRGHQLATLSAVAHAKRTDPELSRLIAEAARTAEGDDAVMLERAARATERATRLPADLVERFSRARSRAHGVWAEARRDDDFARFAPELETMIDLARESADHLGWEAHPYDALHDGYEIGSSTARVRAVFEPLRDATVALLDELRDAGTQLDDAPVRRAFPVETQRAYVRDVAQRVGYDFERGRLDDAVHPFASGMGRTDVRITTRFDERFLNTALFGTLHEAGHAMYEQGLAEADQRTPLGSSISLGIHESQSRLWENLVGRSRAFWEGAYPELQTRFAEALGEVPLDAFHLAINRVEPTPIRVEADEVTYNLHVMVRFELELALIEGELAVAELPGAWNAKYADYLGITPENDTLGVLQDVHWSAGLIGYFPTYALGNLASVQLYDAAASAIPDLEDRVRAGDFAPLLAWLREHVHRPGSRYLPDELLERATGSPLRAEPYLRYLRAKFGALYGLAPAS